MADRDRINKIRNLAERGATEGERAAAREALRRIEAAEPGATTKGQRARVSSKPDMTAADFITSFLNDQDFLRGMKFDPRIFGDMFNERPRAEDRMREAEARRRHQQADRDQRIRHLMRQLRLTEDDLIEFLNRHYSNASPPPHQEQPRYEPRTHGGRVHWE